LAYGSLVVGGMVFLGMIMVFNIAFPFLDAMVCWDVYLGFELWIFWIDFGILGRGGLKVQSQRHRNPWTGIGRIHGKA